MDGDAAAGAGGRHRAGGGPQLAGYRTGRLLGAGGHGEVWAGTDELTGEDVALKLVSAAGEARERLLRELTVLRRIEHPGVVALRDVLDAPGRGTVLVLDLAPGGSLADLVRVRGPLSAGEVVSVLCGLAGTLADLHAGGVVHGDLAPGNVLFTASGRPLLADLGLAGAVALPQAGPLQGTPGFADPGATAATPAGDVRALAAVAWYALTGAAPPARPAQPDPGPGIVRTPGTVALADLLTGVLTCPADGRPDAAELSRRTWATGPAVPVRLVAPDPAAPQGDLLTRRLRGLAGDPGRVLLPPVGGGDAGPRSAARPRARSAARRSSRTSGAIRRWAGGRGRRRGGRRRAAVTVPVPAWWRRRVVAVPVAALVAAVLLGGGFALPGLGRAIGWWPAGGSPGAAAGRSTTEAAPGLRLPRSPPAPGATPERPAATPDRQPVPVTTSPGTSRSPTAPPPTAAADPAAAGRELTRRRAEALALGDDVLLRSVTAAGSTARAADDALLDRLSRSGVRLDGLGVDVRAVRLLDRDGERARVRLTSSAGEHRRVRDGQVVATVPREQPTTVVLHLVRDPDWRVEAVTR